MVSKEQASLTDPASPVFGFVATAVMGALPLIDPFKLNSTTRRALHAATAAATGIYTAVTVDRNSTTLVPFRAVAGLAATAVALRFADAGDALDSRMVQKLRSAGVKYPRRWMAAGSAALTFAAFLADRAAARKEEYEAVSGLERLQPVGPAVHNLTESILRATDVAGAGALLAQLDVAQEIYWDDGFSSTAQFRVPDELPRAVPHNQVFPVRALYTAPNGLPLQVLLQVFDGKIDHLAIDAVDPEYPDSVDDLLDAWPDLSAVIYVLERPDGRTTPIHS
ncbi:hypothetical protein [Pseudarthrobacter sp. NamE5]|uniref:hypothetical protein n=1 Tax=Pseudarthrobacter sp. NamE5 TaxID=2576839 RepID=UPI00110BE6D8|nr:hypothetical protein [Pseudarthrobacter sp. NamE5]TLM87665.1 hypothetical protein FDW84_03495 [Pseudarthrobacter sp. NamE5]